MLKRIRIQSLLSISTIAPLFFVFACTQIKEPTTPPPLQTKGGFLLEPKRPDKIESLGEPVFLNGKNDFLSLGEKQWVLSGAKEATLMVWLKSFQRSEDFQDLIAVSIGGGKAATSSRASLRIEPNGALVAFARTEDNSAPATETRSLPNAVRPGEWQHVAATFKFAENSIEIFLNGKRLQTSALNKPFSNNTTPNSPSDTIAIGSEDDGSKFYFHGSLSQVGIWSRALKPDEIRALSKKRPEKR